MDHLIGRENIDCLSEQQIHLFDESLKWYLMMALGADEEKLSSLQSDAEDSAASIIGETLVGQLLAQEVVIVRTSNTEASDSDGEYEQYG